MIPRGPFHLHCMDWKRECAVIIPCFNEARNIAELVRSVRLFLPNVIVVDDGSTDGTSEKAARAGAAVVRHDRNLGKGTALRSGCRQAREQGFQWALMMDGDGQHAPEDIAVILARAETTNTQLVIGNRMENAVAIPWVRRHANRWMTRRLSNLTGMALADSQCGFRLVKLDVWAALRLTTRRFEIESELLVTFIAAGCRPEFVPIQVIYNARQSKIRVISDSWRWFRWWARELSSKVARHITRTRTVVPVYAVPLTFDAKAQDIGPGNGTRSGFRLHS